MGWAKRSGTPSRPAGRFDPRTQRWKPSVIRTNVGFAASGRRVEAAGKRVLVVTRQFDPHADVVIAALEARGVEAFRVNSDDVLDSCSFAWDFKPGEGRALTVEDRFGRTATLPDGVCAAFFRNPLPVAPHTDVVSTEAKEFSGREGDAFLECVLLSRDVRWVSEPHRVRAAEAKLPQLEVAHRAGLRTPRTFVTNSPDKALAFARAMNFDVAAKPLISATVERPDGVYELLTRRISRAELEERISAVRLAPTVLQEYVPKATEVRVTIIGKDTFATEIDSQSVADAAADWHAVDQRELPYKPVSLPDGLVGALRRFLAHFGLVFGAIDLIRTPAGDYVFLENNPSGGWYWLEMRTGQPMAASMATLLSEQ